MKAPKKKKRFAFSSLHIDDSSAKTRYRQLEDQLRDAICSGILESQTLLPSSRALSKEIGVSRNTVIAAYQQLVSEGYLETEVGSGTRVSQLPPESFEFHNHHTKQAKTPTSYNVLSKNGKLLSQYSEWLPDGSAQARPFRPHLPSIQEFPLQAWNQITHDILRSRSTAQLKPCDPQGYPPLRESIADYMRISRGVACTADQVIITAGAQQGLSLLTQILLDPTDTIWVEDPGNTPALQLLNLSIPNVIPVPLDQYGIDLNSMDNKATPPKLIYVTPGNQWPMAMTMSLNRRMQLIALAQQHKSWILEDDYNGEFRYTSRPHPALISLDNSGQTIYMGTFSKILFPAIRLAFLVVPPQLAKTFAYARWLSDRYSPPLVQMVLHRFIEAGHFVKHIRRMRSLYRERQQRLVQLLQNQLHDLVEVKQPESGMHLVAKGINKKAEAKLLTAAQRAGIEHHTVAMYSTTNQARGIILGFAAFDAQETKKAIKSWARQLQ